jgi:DNA repair protein RadD
MPEIQLREYQERVFDAIRDAAMRGVKRIMVVLGTGSGKTIIEAKIALSAVEKGNTVLSLVHRRGLVEQINKTYIENGLDSGIIMAGIESELRKPCQVGSIFTYIRRMKLDELDRNQFFINADVILIDEAHHVLSKTYQSILKNYPDKIVVGFTATPTLSTGAGMGEYFEELIDVVPLKELLDGGYLVPGVYYGPTVPDLDKLKSRLGDYKPKDLDKVCNKPKLVGDIVENWLKIAPGKQTMVFAINRKHAKALNEEFIKHGVKAEYLDAFNKDEERSDVLRRFKDGDTQVICQIALYTEGTDIPEIECLIDARPTRSIGFHRQKLGRGARPCKGKDSFLVIDHCGNVAGRKDSMGFYEDEITWTLSGKPLSNKPKEKRIKEKTLITCEYCSSIFTGKRCPTCGKEVENYAKKVEALDATLVKLKGGKKKVFTMEEKRHWYGMLEWKRRERGFQTGWVGNSFREKFGVWPTRMKHIGPIEPTKEFKNWLTSRQIRWRKQKEKENNSFLGRNAVSEATPELTT